MRLQTKLVIVAIALQLVLLGSIAAQKSAVLFWSHTVELRIRPYDPKSILSGYYATLTYDISTPVGLDEFDKMEDGTAVYTVIVPDSDGICYTDRMSLDVPRLHANEKFIKGKKIGHQVDYDIDTYFIAEEVRDEVAQGLSDPGNDCRAEVRIDKNGNPALHGLRIGKKTY